MAEDFSSAGREAEAGQSGASASPRILFVEESAELVAGVARALAGRQDWEIAHAENAEEALAIARCQSVDVAVVSATMPDVDPRKLAESLAQIHPKLTVFLLAAKDSGGGAALAPGRWQWLPKPCEPAVLIVSIERMAKLAAWLAKNTPPELVSALRSLPAIPSNYQDIIATFQSSDASLQEIGEALGKDSGMTSRVLQVANSAFYGYSKKITNPTEASLLLGMETLKSLVRYTHVLNNFPRPDAGGSGAVSGGGYYTHVLNSFPQAAAANAVFEKVWRHSLGVAAVAREITQRHTQDEALAEEAFTAGLLHDIGKLVLCSIKPEEYREVMRQAYEAKSAVHRVERTNLGVTHAETGALLLSLWGVPCPILEAVAWHHDPSESGAKRFSALTAVHVANVAEHRRNLAEDARAHPVLDERHLADIGVIQFVEGWLKLSPDKPNRHEPTPEKGYAVQRAAPPPPPAPPADSESAPAWLWAVIAGTAAILAWLIFF